MKAVILDMYGVVIRQTGAEFAPYIQKTFPALTQEEIYAPWLRAYVGELPSAELWRQLGYRGDLAKQERDYLDTMELGEGFESFAADAGKRCRLALLSNDVAEWNRYLREKFGLDAVFGVVSVSGELRMKKPDARIFLHTLERLGCRAEECLFADDRIRNVLAAKRLGMRAVLFGEQPAPADVEAAADFGRLAAILNGE